MIKITKRSMCLQGGVKMQPENNLCNKCSGIGWYLKINYEGLIVRESCSECLGGNN